MACRELRRGWLRLLVLAGALCTSGILETHGQDPSRSRDEDDGSFGLSAPIACKEINGHENYVVLPHATLTSDEKLLVYYLPRHYKSARVGDKFEAHLTQEGRIRRRGEKAVLWSKSKILDYKVATDQPPRLIYLQNRIALKALKPGEYEYDIILRDEIGKPAPVIRTLSFTIVPAAESKADASEKKTPGRK